MFNMAQLFNNVIAAGTGGPLDANFIANITGIVVFVVALIALRILVWPKITAGLDDRNEKIVPRSARLKRLVNRPSPRSRITSESFRGLVKRLPR